MASLLDMDFTESLHEAIHNSEVGRAPYSTKLLFKILLLQQWYGLSDSEAEEQVYERQSFQEFLGLGKEDPIPDESTIGKFRNKLEGRMTDIIFFEEVNRQLEAHGVIWKSGASVDATIVEAPKGRKKKDGGSHQRY
jgi:IS5 family transposase